MQPLPIANGFYESDSLPISHQECVNFYPNIVTAPALNQETLFGTPGIEQLATTGSLVADANRGQHDLNGTPYFVNGGNLYRLNDDNSTTNLGVISGTGRVSMADNGTQLMILVPGGTGYIFTTGPDTLTPITDVDFTANGNPQIVVFIDGYFLCTTDTKKFIVSALNDGLNYNALDFGTAESDPDDIVAPIVYNNQVYIGGSITIESFSNTGGADFPFQRTGLFINKGISSQFGVTNTADSFMWVGGGENESPAIWQLSGNSPVKVSTTAIDSIFQRLTSDELAAVFTWSYAQKGAYFVGFNLPDTTLVYDSITQRWHERKSVVTVNNEKTLERFRVSSVGTAYGKLLVGDSHDGRIGSMDIDIYDEYGEHIHRSVSTQPFQSNMMSIFCPSLELTMESGVGNTSTVDPQVNMARSTDGKTFNYNRPRSIGKIGEYDKRQLWYKNGRASRFEVFRFSMAAKTKAVIIQLSADIRPGGK